MDKRPGSKDGVQRVYERDQRSMLDIPATTTQARIRVPSTDFQVILVGDRDGSACLDGCEAADHEVAVASLFALS